jgi:hypothetical protein
VAGKKRLAGNVAREADSDEDKEPRSEPAQLKEVLVETLPRIACSKNTSYEARGSDA